MIDDGPKTIGHSRQTGELLEIGCYYCGRHGYFRPDSVSLPAELTFPDAVWQLRCSNCGRRNARNWPGYPIWLRVDTRVSPGAERKHFTAEVTHPGRTWSEQEIYLRLPRNTWMVPPDWRRID